MRGSRDYSRIRNCNIMPTIRQVAAFGCYVVASTLLVVTLRVGPDPGEPGGGVVQHQRLFEKYTPRPTRT